MIQYPNIVFDMGRVLTDYDADAATRVFTSDPEIIREVNLVVYHSGEWTLLDAGLISEEEALENMLRHCSGDEVRRVAHLSFLHWHEYNLFPVEEMGQLVRDLKAAGKKCYILSNISRRLAIDDNWKKYVPAADTFDGYFGSALYQTLKPQPLIYERFLETFDLKAEDCLFIDDLKRNIDAAKKTGMGGYVFDGDVVKLREYLGCPNS
uniref:Haloacid dehalogenase superfamily protein, subfamily IA, variant 3 with third motif having DD or ED n=1 Tax=Eubacterium cellulosolvens (strain ATCC 43171 / JCM 9499 / 6) TaxID=633697 RepID=I5AT38_EUBC6